MRYMNGKCGKSTSPSRIWGLIKKNLRASVTPKFRSLDEFVKTGGHKKEDIQVEDLLKSLGQTATVTDLKKRIGKAQKRAQPIAAPLEKPQAEKARRLAGYNRVANEVERWDAVVQQHREADHLSFPLLKPELKLHTAAEFAAKLAPKTPLEQQIAALLQNSKHTFQPGEELTQAEKDVLASMSLKEALERRRELARYRALQSYEEAKARRQNKIKSKKYHRLMKKDRLKKQITAFETLKVTNPDAALKELERLDEQRVEERASLRHKSTGKWAKVQAIRAKYDKDARSVLSEQLKIGKALVEKARIESDDETPESALPVEINSNNPWLRAGAQDTFDEDEKKTNYRKYWTEINEAKAAKRKLMGADSDKIEETQKEEPEGGKPTEAISDDLDQIFNQATKKRKTKAQRKQAASQNQTNSKKNTQKAPEKSIPDALPLKIRNDTLQEGSQRIQSLEDMDELAPGSPEELLEEEKGADRINGKPKDEQKSPQARNQGPEVDPAQFLAMEPRKLKSLGPNWEEAEAESSEDENADDNAQRMTIAEAFAEDDVIQEFRAEKKRLVEASLPTDIDLSLPGWGSWGGTDLKREKSRRRKKRFLIKAPPAPPRRDDNKGHLILNEQKSKALRVHQVTALPFPFTSVAAFESSIRAPVAPTFVPETASRALTKPKVVTRLGTIIEPMDEEALAAKPGQAHLKGAEGLGKKPKEERDRRKFGKNKAKKEGGRSKARK
nr:EOG090X08JJ [Lepidurus arcticus]